MERREDGWDITARERVIAGLHDLRRATRAHRHPQLRHDRHGVHEDGVLDRLAVRRAGEVHRVEVEVPPGCWHPHELAVVGADGAYAPGNGVATLDDVVHVAVDVG